MKKSLFLLLLGGLLMGCQNVSSTSELSVSGLSEDDVKEARLLKISDYQDKVRASYIGQMVGVSWGYPVEFHSHSALSNSQVPTFMNTTILEAYNQDDIYLSVTALEELYNNGLDVSSRDLGILMYNRDFEYWNGSNNDVLIRGYAPPLAGYPFGFGYLTARFPEGNSYQCGISFAGLLSPGIPQSSNELANRFASMTDYGDGIYGTQFVAAMYAESFFTSDYNVIIQKGLEAVPQEALVRLAINDVLTWYNQGLAFENAHSLFMDKYWYDETYNWINWPYGGADGGRTTGINLDAKSCAAFMVMGMLYGQGDFEESIKYTIRGANDTDSNAASVGGILANILGTKNIPIKYKAGLRGEQKFKYSTYTLDDVVNSLTSLVKENVLKYGGKAGIYQGEETLVIPNSIGTVVADHYQCSKNPEPIEETYYTDAEMLKFRKVTDPGFERHNSKSLGNDWKTNNNSKVEVETYVENQAHTGLSNAKIKADGNFNYIYNTANASRNTIYEISFYLKGSTDLTIKLFANSSFGKLIKEETFEISNQWIKVSMSFNSMGYDSLQLGVGFTSDNNQDFLRVDELVYIQK
ncbi:MAG: ADP-ribosylglycohydrolase family protein [Bacillales bacterium]|jgi:hypothetical protein|nr:ADP-ribosylglycohydrolase family protein [Bacillales bacterium]